MLATLFSEALCSFVLIFIYCEFGERVNIGCEEIYDVICQLNWYSYPIEMQRMIPNILIATEQSVIVKGFGNCSCTRESLKKVCSVWYKNSRWLMRLFDFRWLAEDFRILPCYASSEIKELNCNNCFKIYGHFYLNSHVILGTLYGRIVTKAKKKSLWIDLMTFESFI